jgi:hypothetical protein
MKATLSFLSPCDRTKQKTDAGRWVRAGYVFVAQDCRGTRASEGVLALTTITPAEIVKRHSFVASRIARIATGEAAKELKKAIAENKANKKSSK